MKKSNVIITIVLVIAAIVLSGVYRALGFNTVDGGIDYGLAAIWLVMIVAGVSMVTWRENVRKELVRRVYLDGNTVFTAIDGQKRAADLAPTGQADTFVASLAGMLANIQYGFDFQDVPEGFAAKHVIRSAKFKMPKDANAAQDATWSGDICRVLPREEVEAAGLKGADANLVPIAQFSNAQELAQAIADHKLLK